MFVFEYEHGRLKLCEVYHGLTQFIQSIARERLQFPSNVSN
jgi:hypothetical protein